MKNACFWIPNFLVIFWVGRHRLAGHPITQPTNQPTNQPTSQPANQPTRNCEEKYNDETYRKYHPSPNQIWRHFYKINNNEKRGFLDTKLFPTFWEGRLPPAGHPITQPTNQPTSQPANQPTRSCEGKCDETCRKFHPSPNQI